MDWAHHPVTEEFLQELQGSKQETMEAWAAEGYTAQTAEETAIMNATALGGIRVLDQLIEQLTAIRRAPDGEVMELDSEKGVHHE